MQKERSASIRKAWTSEFRKVERSCSKSTGTLYAPRLWALEHRCEGGLHGHGQFKLRSTLFVCILL